MRPTILALLMLPLLLAGAPGGARAMQHPVDNGEPVPAFDLPVFDAVHTHIASSSLRGKVVLIDFWASWCGPCRQSFPLYDRLRAEMPARDFTLLGINLDEMIDGPRAFLEEHPVHYTSVADPTGDVARAFGLIGMPSTFLVDRNGIVRAHHTGFKPKDIDALRKEIVELINEGAAVAENPDGK
jgi:thiol-disulfide isomerase/thioredoxin